MNQDKKEHKPKEQFVTFVLSVLDLSKEPLSAKQIHTKLVEDEKLRKNVGIVEEKQIPSYPTINRILSNFLYKRNLVKWIPEPLKEKKFELNEKGVQYLRGKQCESQAWISVLLIPKDCLHDCPEGKIEECWNEKINLLKEFFDTYLFKINWNEDIKSTIKEILKKPVVIMQILAYWYTKGEIDPIYQEGLSKQFDTLIKKLMNNSSTFEIPPQSKLNTQESTKEEFIRFYIAYNQMNDENFEDILKGLDFGFIPDWKDEAIRMLKLEGNSLVKVLMQNHFLKIKKFRNLVYPFELWTSYLYVDFPSLEIVKLKEGETFCKDSLEFFEELKKYLSELEEYTLKELEKSLKNEK